MSEQQKPKQLAYSHELKCGVILIRHESGRLLVTSNEYLAEVNGLANDLESERCRSEAALRERDEWKSEARRLATRGDVAKALLAQIENTLNAAGVPTLHSDIGAAERKPMLIRERVEWLAENRNEQCAEVERLTHELFLALAAEERAKKSRDEAWCRASEAKAEAPTINQQLTVRPEPSRLEIAAMLLAACLNRKVSCDWVIEDEVLCALDDADKLIAAAKEGVRN